MKELDMKKVILQESNVSGYFSHIHQTNLLFTNFSSRLSYITFLQCDYRLKKREAFFSIAVSSYERVECLSNSFKALIEFRPKNTEIVICDDSSHSPEKNSLLKTISERYKNDDVYVLRHTKNFGAFHTKLDAFLFCVGEFIMSLDDDDYFDNGFYIELASQITKAINSKQHYNFIIPLHLKTITWIKFPMTISKMIYMFHNHYCFAFRRSLLADVNYPLNNFTIMRDDAPLMIPLYIKSQDSQIFHYENKYQYYYSYNKVCNTTHQLPALRSHKKEVQNGHNFLLSYIEKIGHPEFRYQINRAYSYI